MEPLNSLSDKDPEQNQTPPPPSNLPTGQNVPDFEAKRWLSWPLVFGVVVVATAALAFIGFKQLSNRQQLTTEIPESRQTYINNEFEFEVSYPPSYHITDGTNIFNYDSSLFEKGNPSGVKIQITRNIENTNTYDLSTASGVNEFVSNKNEIARDDNNVTEIKSLSIGSIQFKQSIFAGPGGAFDIYYYFPGEDSLYYTISVWGQENDSEGVNQILSTFKFVDQSVKPSYVPCDNKHPELPCTPDYTSDVWQTYRNEEYGFEFEYPSNWVASEMRKEGRLMESTVHFTYGDEEFAELSCPVREVGYEAWEGASGGGRREVELVDGTNATISNTNFRPLYEDFDSFSLIYIMPTIWTKTCQISIKGVVPDRVKVADHIYQTILLDNRKTSQ